MRWQKNYFSKIDRLKSGNSSFSYNRWSYQKCAEFPISSEENFIKISWNIVWNKKLSDWEEANVISKSVEDLRIAWGSLRNANTMPAAKTVAYVRGTVLAKRSQQNDLDLAVWFLLQ